MFFIAAFAAVDVVIVAIFSSCSKEKKNKGKTKRKQGKAKRTFTRLNVLCFALFAQIFLPFLGSSIRKVTTKTTANAFDYEMDERMDVWLDGWTIICCQCTKKKRMHSYKCSPKLYFFQLDDLPWPTSRSLWLAGLVLCLSLSSPIWTQAASVC